MTTISPASPGGNDAAFAVDDLDDDVLAADVHAAVGALVGDEAGIAAAVAVGDAAAEGGRDQFPLVVVEPFRGDEGDVDAEVVQPLAGGPGMARDVRQCRRIAEQHARPESADLADEAIELGRRHLEGRQQFRPQQFVANQADPILRAQLDRRAPDDDLRIADIDAPPTGRAPLGGHVVADALEAHVEDQWLAAGAAGVVALERPGDFRLEVVVANQRLGQQRQALQIGQAGHGRRDRSRSA